MVKVKICGLTNLEDARHAAACGADLLGFIFVPDSPRYVSPTQAAGIIGTLRANGSVSRMVGIFAGLDRAQVAAITRRGEFDYVQLHGDEPPAYARDLAFPVIVARRVADRIPWEELAAYDAAAYLLDAYRPDALGGTGAAWDWRILAGAPVGVPLILAGGLTPANVAQAVATATELGAPPWAVDVSSGVERAPGLKDPDRVRAFIAAAKGASA
jgi:phosphoribosylanthranilate isomerase